ncbi:MAG: cupin domain-containing protein [Porticoccaceae bacterium]|nr:cupin domain-containing protein [Porticoccaceae bacterium]
MAPGISQPRHKHETSEQIWIALAGTGHLLLAEGETHAFKAGDVARFEPGDSHGLCNNGSEVFTYISVTSPPIDFGYAYKDSNQQAEAYRHRSKKI